MTEIVLYQPTNAKQSSIARAHAAKVGYQRSAKASKLKERHRHLNGIIPERLEKSASRSRNSDLQQRLDLYSGDADKFVAPGLARNVPLSRFGGASLPTIDGSVGLGGAEVADFLGTYIWPNVGGLVVASQWFQDFCTVPTLYHAQTAASATYRDLMGGRDSWSGSSTTLQHRIQAVRLIKATLERYSNLASEQREQLIFAILILGSHEVKAKDFEQMQSPFFSYFPTASLLHLWARTDPIHAHDNAAFTLIEGQGGLDALDSPGLAPMAALVDLLRACTQNVRPRFPCFWKHHVLDVMDDFIDHTGRPTATCPGIGFTLLATKLPASAISVLTEIACLDRLMSISSSQNASGSNIGFLLDVRNATLHRLCCLGPLNEQSENTTVDVTLYEAIKFAAVI